MLPVWGSGEAVSVECWDQCPASVSAQLALWEGLAVCPVERGPSLQAEVPRRPWGPVQMSVTLPTPPSPAAPVFVAFVSLASLLASTLDPLGTTGLVAPLGLSRGRQPGVGEVMGKVASGDSAAAQGAAGL